MLELLERTRNRQNNILTAVGYTVQLGEKVLLEFRGGNRYGGRTMKGFYGGFITGCGENIVGEMREPRLEGMFHATLQRSMNTHN